MASLRYRPTGTMRLRWRSAPVRPRALRLNRRFSKILRWAPFRDRIGTLLGVNALSPVDLSAALHAWQQSRGLPPDGVLGPDTWKKMQPALNAPEPAEPPPPPEEPAAATSEPPAEPDAAASPDQAPTEEPAQGEVHYGFRARRRCQCAKCRRARAAGPPCTCPSCEHSQSEQESPWDWISQFASASSNTTPNYTVNRKSAAYIRWYQDALNRIISAGLAIDGVAGSRTRAAVRQFQSQNGLTADGIVGAQTEAALIRAGAGMPPASGAPSPEPTPAPVGSNAAVNTPLPSSAPGVYSYGRQSRQYGTAQTIQALLSVGRRFAAAYPNGPAIGIGDISLQGGGLMKPHVSHQKGVDVDIHLMRNDNVRGGTTYKLASYSRALTQQLVDMIRTNDVVPVDLILCNDPELTGVKPWPGHDNHLHVRFKAAPATREFEYELGEEFRSHGTRCDCHTCRELQEQELGELETGAINRKSTAYIRWYQDALNRILPASLAVDGKLGPKTRAAVAAFQRRSSLKADGIVGPATEAALTRAGAPPPPRQGSLPGPAPIPPGPQPTPNIPCGPSPTLSQAEKDVLAVTSTLEGGRPFHCAVSATDGISMGSMQWNLKAGTLQNMLTQFERGTGRLSSYFGADTDRLKALIDLQRTSTANAVSQATTEKLAARWKDPLSRLCADPFMCALQQRDIASRLCTSWDNFTRLGLGTVRGLSMCYDIINGDGAGAMKQVREKALAQTAWASTPESERLRQLANFAADRLGKYREERRARRLNLANIRTVYRRAPATAPQSYADQINRTVPGLDRALTTSERTACSPAPTPPVPRPPAPPSPTPPSPTPVQTGEKSCPTSGEAAAGCQTPKRCNAIPNLLCLRSVAGVPIDYLSKFTSTNPKRAVFSSHQFRIVPGVRDAIANFLRLATGFGLPVERVLSQGGYLCRCQRDRDVLSNHGKGEAIDIGGVRLQPAGREVLAINFTNPGERVLVRRVNACLRLAFPRVIDYNYNSLHHDHFHCEISIPARVTKERTTLVFVQEALSLVLGRTVPVTGKFDAGTQQALRDFGATQADLADAARLNAVYDRLFTQVARGGTGSDTNQELEFETGSSRRKGMVLAFRIPEAPYSDENFDRLHKGFEIVEGVHAIVEIAGIEIAGMLGLAFTALAPLAGMVANFMALGAGYMEGRAKVAKDRLRVGFAKGFAMGADGRRWTYTKRLFFEFAPEVNTFDQDAGKIAQQAFNLGLAAGFLQGKKLSQAQRKFLWNSIRRNLTAGDRAEFTGGPKTTAEWRNWYTRVGGLFLKLYAKD